MQVKPLVCTGELSGIVVELSRLISTDTDDGQAANGRVRSRQLDANADWQRNGERIRQAYVRR